MKKPIRRAFEWPLNGVNYLFMCSIILIKNHYNCDELKDVNTSQSIDDMVSDETQTLRAMKCNEKL